jgi:hypothetical protein
VDVDVFDIRATGPPKPIGRMRTRSSDEASKTDVITHLPLLPLVDAVLLPGAFLRVHLSSKGHATALLQHLLRQEGDEVLVAAVPLLPPMPGRKGCTVPPLTEEEGEEGGIDLGLLHELGTAARIVQLSRRTQVRLGAEAASCISHHLVGRVSSTPPSLTRSPPYPQQAGGWVVVVEGICRVRVREVAMATSAPMYVATVEQLDYLPVPTQKARGGGAGRGALTNPLPGTGSGASADRALEEREALMRQLIEGTERLFLRSDASARERGGVGSSAGRERKGASDAVQRVARRLQAQGPARISDIVGSLVARGTPQLLELLGLVNVEERLRVVVGMVHALLGAKGASKVAKRTSAQGAAPPPSTLAERGSDRGAGSGEEGGEEGGRGELDGLMKRLEEAGPPAEVREWQSN